MIKALQIARAYQLMTHVNDIKIAVENLNNETPCKEFQNLLMDLESSQIQIAKFIEEGPSTAYVDIPLAQSEVEEY